MQGVARVRLWQLSLVLNGWQKFIYILNLLLSVCLSACWSRPWAVQKRLNRSRCRLACIYCIYYSLYTLRWTAPCGCKLTGSCYKKSKNFHKRPNRRQNILRQQRVVTILTPAQNFLATMRRAFYQLFTSVLANIWPWLLTMTLALIYDLDVDVWLDLQPRDLDLHRWPSP